MQALKITGIIVVSIAGTIGFLRLMFGPPARSRCCNALKIYPGYTTANKAHCSNCGRPA